MAEQEKRHQNGRKKKKKGRTKKNAQMMRSLIAGSILLVLILLVVGTATLVNRKHENELLESRVQLGLSGVRETAAGSHTWEDLPKIGAEYAVHKNDGSWSPVYADHRHAMAPAGGYVTAVKVGFAERPGSLSGDLEVSVNLSGSGWLDWAGSGICAGTETADTALEAVKLRLTGQISDYYDVLYSVLQNGAWTDWVKNGEEAGASGVGLHMDGLRVSLARKQPGKESYAGELDPSRPMVALTYDDGPSPKATPRILEKLREYDARATFFMVGQQAEKNPDLVRQMAAQGCEVANHTYTHTSMNKMSPEELVEQLNHTNQVIRDLCGVTPVLMRPVGGNENTPGLAGVGSLSMPAILWSVDTLDWKTKDAANTLRVVRKDVKDGDIILMHDLYEQTADASMTLIQELSEQGFQLVTVSELAAYRGGYLPGKSYTCFRP